jgi:hypothetical protein
MPAKTNMKANKMEIMTSEIEESRYGYVGVPTEFRGAW